MQDAVFALGAQLAYYNWHNYNAPDKDMYTILKNKDYLDKLNEGKLENFKEENTSFIEKINEKDVFIYKETDKRLIMMYSENRDDPNENPLFIDLFKDWNFLEGMDHNKAYAETITKFVMKREEKECSWMGLSKEESGFQAFAMEKGNDILISYRGTDFGPLSNDEFKNDMFATNIKIFMKKIYM